MTGNGGPLTGVHRKRAIGGVGWVPRSPARTRAHDHKFRLAYLFAGVGRQVKHQNRHERQSDARDDQVDGVEQSLASHFYVERDVCKTKKQTRPCQAGPRSRRRARGSRATQVCVAKNYRRL